MLIYPLIVFILQYYFKTFINILQEHKNKKSGLKNQINYGLLFVLYTELETVVEIDPSFNFLKYSTIPLYIP